MGGDTVELTFSRTLGQDPFAPLKPTTGKQDDRLFVLDADFHVSEYITIKL